MADHLTDEEMKELRAILDMAEEHEGRLSSRSRDFVADQRDRLEKYGAGMRLSSKQWAWLQNIREQIESL